MSPRASRDARCPEGHWLRSFDRGDLWSGRLYEAAVTGALGTRSTFRLFERGVMASRRLHPGFHHLAEQGFTAREILEALRIEDIRHAHDLFHELDASPSGGWVIVEAALARDLDAAALHRAAFCLYEAIGRARVAVQLPTSTHGFEVGAILLGQGVAVAFSPLVSPPEFGRAAEAYRIGLETRLRVGGQPQDLRAFGWLPRFRARGTALPPSTLPGSLLTAIEEALHAIDVRAGSSLAEIGGHPFTIVSEIGLPEGQASLPTAIGAGSVLWLEARTLGSAELTSDGPPPEIGVLDADGLAQLGAALRAEEAAAARAARRRMLGEVESLRLESLSSMVPNEALDLGEHTERYAWWLQHLDEASAAPLLEAEGESERQAEMIDQISILEDLLEELADADVEQVVWVAEPEEAALARIWVELYDQVDEAPELLVVDAEAFDPDDDALEEASVLVFAGSASNTPLSAAVRRALKSVTPERCVALTHPGSTLEAVAEAEGFFAILAAPPELTPLEAAFSPYALFPAALMGLDLDALTSRAGVLLGSCGAELPVERHPGARLGALLALAAELGPGRVVLEGPSGLDAFLGWLWTRLEQSRLPLSLVHPDRYRPRRAVPVQQADPNPPPAPRTQEHEPASSEGLGSPVLRIAYTLLGPPEPPIASSLPENPAEPPQVIGVDPASLVGARFGLSDRLDVVQELLRWSFALRVAEHLFHPPSR